MLARLLTLLALAAVAVVPAAQSAPFATPTGLRAFLLKADEPITDTFPRTPSFAWAPYDNAVRYDFELATSKTFDESTIVWSTSSRAKPLQVPVVAIPVALPWMTGNPYALYVHVRARTPSGLTKWSTPFGFNMTWKSLPQNIVPDIPGLVRWQPVEGATSYDVWFVNAGKVITTTTNVADEREYYSFHQDPLWTGSIQWRVRAVRQLYGSIPNGLPVVTVGPWSQTFVATNPQASTGSMTLIETGIGRGHDHRPARAAPPHPGVCLQRRHGRERPDRAALPRLRRDRPAVREHRLHGRSRRQPGVRTPDERPPRPPRDACRRHGSPVCVPGGRKPGGHVHR